MFIKSLVLVYIFFALRNILFSKDGLNNSLIWITYGMIIGYRTFEPIAGLKIHPIEILVYAGILRIILTNIYPIINLPKVIVFLSYIFLAFFILDFFTRYNPMVLVEFKNSFLLISIFFLIKHIEINEKAFTSFAIAKPHKAQSIPFPVNRTFLLFVGLAVIVLRPKHLLCNRS